MLSIKIDILGKEHRVKVNRSTTIREIKYLIALYLDSSNKKIDIFYAGSSVSESLSIQQVIFRKEKLSVAINETTDNLQKIEEALIPKDLLSMNSKLFPNLNKPSAEAIVPKNNQDVSLFYFVKVVRVFEKF